MRLLLDTHILLWWLMGGRRLPKRLAATLSSSDNDVAVSAASLWEIMIKRGLGRVDVDVEELLSSIASDGFSELPVQFRHTLALQSLPRHHDDPFDRILIAQSLVERRRLVTTDRAIHAYAGVPGFDPITD
ncbi:MAG TPA: type II toxin-antitoxin system VapC family toxin [Thermoanaerobaculia bacterium]|nr:type II toxin-antitoxin system VapC family toxin [Thermoanaerobaculia bacterium]